MDQQTQGSDRRSPRADAPHVRLSAIALVFVGGLAGTGLRYLVAELCPTTGDRWPWATFGVNLAGAFILGGLLELLVLAGPDAGWRQRVRVLVGTGFCGSLTTYSTFALEAARLAGHGAVLTSVGYAMTSVVAGVTSAWLGIVIAGALLARRIGAVS